MSVLPWEEAVLKPRSRLPTAHYCGAALLDRTDPAGIYPFRPGHTGVFKLGGTDARTYTRCLNARLTSRNLTTRRRERALK